MYNTVKYSTLLYNSLQFNKESTIHWNRNHPSNVHTEQGQCHDTDFDAATFGNTPKIQF